MIFVFLSCALGGVVGLLALSKLWHWITSGHCTSTRRMDGKIVIVTGANSGKRPNVHVLPLDLTSLASVRRFVQLVKQQTSKLHVLVNNAGCISLPHELTKDGMQLEMQTNHFGPFLLTLLLLDLLKKSAPSRVLMVSSEAYMFAKLRMDDLNCERYLPGDWTLYSNTKLANILCSNELARRLHGTGVTCNSLHPGVVRTEVFRTVSPSWFRAILNFVYGFGFKNAEQGAQTSIYLSVAEEVEHVTGKYFTDCKETSTSKKARDENSARMLWEESLRLVKLREEEVAL
ncbi:hypothetical protein B566_EDAN013270 [Ephemera danica]|nr:hypothetical protein B566_EDAN013270 [Ephemera danica]